jgi:hypothetical protein
MNQLSDFINGSNTFIGFDFNGNYTMPEDIFYKLFDHFNKTGENHLDVYSNMQYLIWEIKEDSENLHDFTKCEQYESYISISRKLKLYDVNTISEVRQYVRKCWYKYRDYLDHLRNEPRRKACRFTALKEVKEYVYGKYGKRCLCCGSIEKISLDHVIPIQKGGKDEVENLQPLCKSCNSRKNIKIIDYRK